MKSNHNLSASLSNLSGEIAVTEALESFITMNEYYVFPWWLFEGT